MSALRPHFRIPPLRTLLAVLVLLALLPAARPGSAWAQPRAGGPAPAEAAPLLPAAVLQELDATWQAVRQAKDAYDEALLGNNPGLLNQRWETIKATHADLYRAERKADELRVQALSRVSGRSPAEIQAMREGGRGWGSIAKELGVPASALGLGHGRGDPVERAAEKAKRDQELNQQRDQDRDQDRDRDHGKGKDKDKDKEKDKDKGSGHGPGKEKDRTKGVVGV